MKDLKDWNSTTGTAHKSILFHVADIRGFNRFINISQGIETVFALYDLSENRIVDRFLFNVGQPGRSIESYSLHTDIKGVGKMVSIFESNHASGFWDMLLKYNSTYFRIIASQEDNFFRITIKIAGEQDPGLLPFVYTGPLWDSKISVNSDLSTVNSDLCLENPDLCLENPDLCDNSIICLNGLEYPLFLKFSSMQDRDRNLLFLKKSTSESMKTFIRRAVENPESLSAEDLSPNKNREINCVVMPFSESCNICFSQMAQNLSGIIPIDEKILEFEIDPCEDKNFDNEISARIHEDECDATIIYRVLETLVSSNTVIDPADNTFYTILNRSWVDMLERIFKLDDKWIKGPFISNWAGSFSALLSSLFSPNLAKNNILKIINTREPGGKIPEFQLTDKISDRSCLPVLAFCIWKIYQRNGDSTLISAVFEHLLEWVNWFEKNRKDTFGLYTWGSDNPESTDQFGTSEGFTDATWESGMENSPMWDELTWNSSTSLVSASCAGLSSMIALNYRILSKMADLLGMSEQKEILGKKSDEICSRIDELLYDSRTNTYKNRRHDGAFVRTVTPTSFLPMLAGIPDRKRGENIIKYGLFNNDLCWGNFPLSSVAKSYWGYDPDGPGWRGRVWPPLNYLVYQGLKRYSPCHAARLAADSAALFLREYKSHGHVHENYSARTGWGEAREGEYTRSCPWFTWGGLLGLMLLEEILDIDMDGMMRFGSPFFDRPVKLDKMLIKGLNWSVITSSDSTTAHVGNRPFFYSCPGTGVRNMIKSDERLNFDIIGQGETTIKVHPEALGVVNAVARVYDSDIFLGRFDLTLDPAITFDLNLEPMVPKSIKIKLLNQIKS